jgi:hypothetical protein
LKCRRDFQDQKKKMQEMVEQGIDYTGMAGAFQQNKRKSKGKGNRRYCPSGFGYPVVKSVDRMGVL